MVENTDFDWQVFISYSWNDNTGTGKKWVDEFEQLLDEELKRVGHGKRIKLWQDKNQVRGVWPEGRDLSGHVAYPADLCLAFGLGTVCPYQC